jgi:hypothetical protein
LRLGIAEESAELTHSDKLAGTTIEQSTIAPALRPSQVAETPKLD